LAGQRKRGKNTCSKRRKISVLSRGIKETGSAKKPEARKKSRWTRGGGIIKQSVKQREPIPRIDAKAEGKTRKKERVLGTGPAQW